VAEIEKSIIRPTLEEWKTIFQQGISEQSNKAIHFYIKREGLRGSSDIKTTTSLLYEVYEALIREKGGTNVDETLRNLRVEEVVNPLRNLGFNSSKEAKWVIDAIKNPKLDKVMLYVDANNEIERLDFVVSGGLNNVVQHPVIYNNSKGRISFDSRRNYKINNSRDVIVDDLEDEYINIFDFDNTHREKVSYIMAHSYSIDPSTMETLNFKTNFLPTKEAITNNTSDINTLQEFNNFYIIKPKALNKLLSGKKVKPVIIEDIDEINIHRERINYKGINYVQGETMLESVDEKNYNTPLLNLVNQPLESIPNYFKEDIYQDKLNEVLTPDSVKKITSRLQYEVRLQGRQTREGRGEGKYTGDKPTERNTPQLGFTLYHIKNHFIYFPKMKEELPLYIVAFYKKKYPYGDETWEPTDRHMLFYSDSEVNMYLGERMVSNKDWIKVSKNITRDTVNGLVSYLESLKVSYRVKGQLDLSKFTPEVQDKINNNIKDIVENSMFGFLSQTKRRGRRMVVKKNLLKSASDIKRVGDEIVRSKFGPLKEFKDLNEDEILTFESKFRNEPYGQEYLFGNTEFNLEYIFEPLPKNLVTNNLAKTSNSDKTSILSKIENLDGDIFQYFSISSKVKSSKGEIGMGVLVFCYFFKDNKLDKIEAVVASISRYSSESSKGKNTISVAKKEISIEYPFDDMGVFMYEIVTGSKYSIMMRATQGGEASFINSPPRRASTMFETVLQDSRRFGQIIVDKMQYNDLRNQHIGYIAGRNNYNAMYYYLYSDSDYYGGSEEGQLCIGKIDLVYKRALEDLGGRGREFADFTTSPNLEPHPTLQSFKDAYSVGIVVTERGSCLQGKDIPKGDNTAFQALWYVLGGIDYDNSFSYRNIKDNKERAGMREGLPTDAMAEGFTTDDGRRIPPMSGQNTYRDADRLRTHLSLVKKYGQEFLNWTDSLVKKVLEAGEIKIGGKNISSGTSSGANFNEFNPNSAWAHKAKIRQSSVDIRENMGRIPEANRIFFQRYGRMPTGRDTDVVQGIEQELSRGE